MNQSELRSLAETSAQDCFNAFFSSRDEETRDILVKMQVDLEKVVTSLTQEDLASRTEAFSAVARTMKDDVLPAIKKLDERVAKLVVVDQNLKTVMTNLVKLSSSVTFLAIPV